MCYLIAVTALTMRCVIYTFSVSVFRAVSNISVNTLSSPNRFCLKGDALWIRFLGDHICEIDVIDEKSIDMWRSAWFSVRVLAFVEFALSLVHVLEI